MQIAVLCHVPFKQLESGMASGILSEFPKSRLLLQLTLKYSPRLGCQRIEGRQSMSVRHSSSEYESTSANHASTSCKYEAVGRWQALGKGDP